jgi:hypothetical protein
MLFALAGVAIDQRSHQGYSTWLSACREAGISAGSVLAFTLALLPTAIIGMLAGGAALLLFGVLMRGHPGGARLSLAAHAGCVMGMVAGLLLCTLALAPSLMLVAEALLAAGGAAWLFCADRWQSADAKASAGRLTSAQ